MVLSIDEIYELFIWDASYTQEEYDARVNRGIEEARKLKNIFPFLQPLILPPSKSKSTWDACAKVVALKSNEELVPYLYLIFQWLQDMNWPGAEIIFNRLLEFPFTEIQPYCDYSWRRAKESKDKIWLETLKDFRKQAEKNK